MASAVGLRSEHTVHIDRSKESVNLRTDAKEDLENDNGDSQMSFPTFRIFLYLDYERVLSVYSMKLVTKRLIQKAGVRNYVHPFFRMALPYGR